MEARARTDVEFADLIRDAREGAAIRVADSRLRSFSATAAASLSQEEALWRRIRAEISVPPASPAPAAVIAFPGSRARPRRFTLPLLRPIAAALFLAAVVSLSVVLTGRGSVQADFLEEAQRFLAAAETVAADGVISGDEQARLSAQAAALLRAEASAGGPEALSAEGRAESLLALRAARTKLLAAGAPAAGEETIAVLDGLMARLETAMPVLPVAEADPATAPVAPPVQLPLMGIQGETPGAPGEAETERSLIPPIGFWFDGDATIDGITPTSAGTSAHPQAPPMPAPVVDPGVNVDIDQVIDAGTAPIPIPEPVSESVDGIAGDPVSGSAGWDFPDGGVWEPVTESGSLDAIVEGAWTPPAPASVDLQAIHDGLREAPNGDLLEPQGGLLDGLRTGNEEAGR